jgi:hypothetical protein
MRQGSRRKTLSYHYASRIDLALPSLGHRFTQSHGRLPTGIPISDHWKGRAKMVSVGGAFRPEPPPSIPLGAAAKDARTVPGGMGGEGSGQAIRKRVAGAPPSVPRKGSGLTAGLSSFSACRATARSCPTCPCGRKRSPARKTWKAPGLTAPFPDANLRKQGSLFLPAGRIRDFKRPREARHGIDRK